MAYVCLFLVMFIIKRLLFAYISSCLFRNCLCLLIFAYVHFTFGTSSVCPTSILDGFERGHYFSARAQRSRDILMKCIGAASYDPDDRVLVLLPENKKKRPSLVKSFLSLLSKSSDAELTAGANSS
jgi:hypothetical protein